MYNAGTHKSEKGEAGGGRERGKENYKQMDENTENYFVGYKDPKAVVLNLGSIEP